MSSPVVFSLTRAQRDYLLTLRRHRSAWVNFDKRVRETSYRLGYATQAEKPRLTPLGVAIVRLATLAAKASHIRRSPAR